MVADEISWPSAIGEPVDLIGLDIATTQAGQARNIAAVLPMLAADRYSLGLEAFYYYTWAGAPQAGGLLFDYAGLFNYVGGALVTKPAYGAFERAALAIEGCTRKGPIATMCARRR